MSDGRQPPFGDPQFWHAWMKSAVDFWGGMMQPKSPENLDPGGSDGEDAERKHAHRSRETLESLLKTWQTLSRAAGDSGSMEAATKLGGIIPEVVLKLMQSNWKGLLLIHQQWMERAGRLGQSAGPFSFDILDPAAMRAWRETYEQEFSRYFSIPQLGLTRFHQERMSQTIDQFNKLQASAAEFLALFFQPMEQSMRQFQEQVAQMADAGTLPENQDAYYKLWINLLEGNYMALLKSPEYIDTMGRALDALEHYLAARDDVLQDLLRALAVPTQKEMDELYRELYLLKKRLRHLEAQNRAGGPRA